jgi:dephospho-CoA kinase
MLKVGITGGIGSGKSIVCEVIIGLDYPVYNSDAASKHLCDTFIPLKEALISAFGKDIYNESKLNRKRFARIIFNNPKELEKANDIIHPYVAQDFLKWASTQTTSQVFLESAILFESGFNQLVDKTVLVYAPLKLRLQRAINRDGEEQRNSILQRVEQQISDELKLKQADFIIYNDENQLVIPQIHSILNSIS